MERVRLRIAHVEQISAVLPIQVTCSARCSPQHRVWGHSQCQDMGTGSNVAFGLCCEGANRELVNSGNSTFAYLCVFRCRRTVGEAWGVAHDISNTACMWGGQPVAMKGQYVWEGIESVVRPAGNIFLMLLAMSVFNLSLWYLSLESYRIQLLLELDVSFKNRQ